MFLILPHFGAFPTAAAGIDLNWSGRWGRIGGPRAGRAAGPPARRSGGRDDSSSRSIHICYRADAASRSISRLGVEDIGYVLLLSTNSLEKACSLGCCSLHAESPRINSVTISKSGPREVGAGLIDLSRRMRWRSTGGHRESDLSSACHVALSPRPLTALSAAPEPASGQAECAATVDTHIFRFLGAVPLVLSVCERRGLRASVNRCPSSDPPLLSR